jgi:hypothetical protein
MRKSIDKRNTGRIKMPNIFIEYKVKGSDTPFKVEIVNISSGGLCFLRNSILTKNDVLLIKFPFKNAKVILEAQVLRLDGREVGVKFLNPEDEIGRFVEAFNYEYPSLSREAKGKGQPLLFTKSRDDEDDPDSALDID